MIPNYDVLCIALEFLDYPTLLQCSLVNSELNRIASKLLYSTVSLQVVSTGGIEKLQRQNQFESSLLKRNAAQVLTLEISGRVCEDWPPSIKKLVEQVRDAIDLYPNLRKCVLAPASSYLALFTPTILSLLACPHLCDLTLNAAYTEGQDLHVLTRLVCLKKLTLIDPARAILEILPGWLSTLSETLLELHFKNNCGSITPGVLRSFLPHVVNIRAMSIGLSYSLTDSDVFTFLNALPHLRNVELQYYLQLASPKHLPPLPTLRSFTVKHPHATTRFDAHHLASWISRSTRLSPLLTSLCLSSKPLEMGGPDVPLDALVDSFASSPRRARVLRVLDLGGALVSAWALAKLCSACEELRVLNVGVGTRSLPAFVDGLEMLPKLHTVVVSLRNATRARKLNAFVFEDAERVLRRSSNRCLRRIVVDRTMWQGAWKSEEDGTVRFVVEEVSKQFTSSTLEDLKLDPDLSG